MVSQDYGMILLYCMWQRILSILSQAVFQRTCEEKHVESFFFLAGCHQTLNHFEFSNIHFSAFIKTHILCSPLTSLLTIFIEFMQSIKLIQFAELIQSLRRTLPTHSVRAVTARFDLSVVQPTALLISMVTVAESAELSLTIEDMTIHFVCLRLDKLINASATSLSDPRRRSCHLTVHFRVHACKKTSTGKTHVDGMAARIFSCLWG